MPKCITDFAKIVNVFSTTSFAEFSVSEIVNHTQLSLSKVSRMLSDFEKEGFLDRNADNGKYRIGVGFFEIGQLYVLNHPLRNIVRPHVEQMARDLVGYAAWMIMEQGKVFVLDRIRNPDMHHLQFSLIGSKIPMHSTCSGKVFLAYMSEAEQDEFFKQNPKLAKYSENTMVDPGELKESFKMIKERGYASAKGETVREMSCIAAPIFNNIGNVVAAMNFAYSNVDCTDDFMDKATNYLIKKATFISSQLGFDAFNAAIQKKSA